MAGEDGQRFVWWMWKLKLHFNTIKNYFARACLTPRALSTKSVGAKLSLDEAVAMYKDDISKWRQAGYLSDLFYNIDCFYGSRRNEHAKTWAPKGSSAIKRGVTISWFLVVFLIVAALKV